MPNAIVDNTIAGTRVTVWNITHYLEGGDWTQQEIAEVLGLSLEQVAAAVKYIDDHKEEVWAVHREIEARRAKGNSPEVEAQAAESGRKMKAWLKDRRLAGEQGKNRAATSR